MCYCFTSFDHLRLDNLIAPLKGFNWRAALGLASSAGSSFARSGPPPRSPFSSSATTASRPPSMMRCCSASTEDGFFPQTVCFFICSISGKLKSGPLFCRGGGAALRIYFPLFYSPCLTPPPQVGLHILVRTLVGPRLWWSLDWGGGVQRIFFWRAGVKGWEELLRAKGPVNQ